MAKLFRLLLVVVGSVAVLSGAVRSLFSSVDLLRDDIPHSLIIAGHGEPSIGGGGGDAGTDV